MAKKLYLNSNHVKQGWHCIKNNFAIDCGLITGGEIKITAMQCFHICRAYGVPKDVESHKNQMLSLVVLYKPSTEFHI